MGLRKGHVKKEKSSVNDSGLFGIIDNAESSNQMRNSERSLPALLSFRARKSVRDAMLEAEYRKAQVFALTRQMRYM